MDGQPNNSPLRRTLSFSAITFYGVGTIVGGGFYALLGEVAGHAGMRTPLAFLTAAVVALFCGLSFSELSARFPYSAGEARYVMEAFGWPWLSATVGWMVITTGIVSAATLASAFAVFLQSMIPIPAPLIVAVLMLTLGAVSAWGIGESAVLVTVITLIEVGGLVCVAVVAGGDLRNAPAEIDALLPSARIDDWTGILLGAYLGFYSFVGFEDMVNLAEEVKNPKRNLPRAILVSLGLTAALYVVVSLVAVCAISPNELAEASTPLSVIVGGGSIGVVLTFIGMLAGINGTLVQIVMASRVAYGLSRQGQAPRFLGRVHPKTQTPIPATVAATLLVIGLAIGLSLVTLAKLTSTVLLLVYALVCLSLFVIKRREPTLVHEGPNYPKWVPLGGFVLCALFVLFQLLWQTMLSGS